MNAARGTSKDADDDDDGSSKCLLEKYERMVGKPHHVVVSRLKLAYIRG